jgi:hypothetical protein
MELKPDDIWNTFENAPQSLEQFCEQYVPEMKLRTQVHDDIFKEYEIIQKLLVHSYYEYKFIDVAVAKLLHTFEMALTIRFGEVNDNKKPPRSLQKMIEWFRLNNFFEQSNEHYFDVIRKVRNIVSHPSNHSFGGIAKFHWFNQITDLINEIHADIPERVERKTTLEKVNKILAEVLQNGAKIDLITESLIIYEAQCFLYHEGRHYGYYKSIFKPEEELKKGENRPYNFGLIEFEDYEVLVGNTFSANPFNIKKLEKKSNLTKYKNWLVQYQKDIQNQMFDNIMNIKLGKKIADYQRKILHEPYFKK